MIEVRPAIFTVFKEASALTSEQLTNVFTRFEATQLKHFQDAISAAQTKNADIESVRDMLKTLGLSISDIAPKPDPAEQKPVVDKLAHHVAKNKEPVKQPYAKSKTIDDKYLIGSKAVKMASGGMKNEVIAENLNVNTAMIYACKAFYKAASKLKTMHDIGHSKIEIGKGVNFDVATKLIKSACQNPVRKLSVNSDYTVCESGTFRGVIINANGVPNKIKLMTHEHYNTFITRK